MITWLSQFFLNPAFVLPGIALVAVPVIIHLLNRLRYKRVRFAAMEFLLHSQQRNRRRLLLEQLLLLLLRMAAVALIAFLLARPYFDASQLLILQGEKAHHVILVDDSGSMQDRWGETTAYKSALDVARRIVQDGTARPGTQQLTWLWLSRPAEPLFTQAALDPPLLSELEAKLEGARPTARQLDLAAGLQAAAEQLRQPAAAKHLHVIADYRAPDWGVNSAVAQAFKDLAAQGIDVHLLRAVPEQHSNLGVLELSGQTHVVAANVPMRLTAKIKNFGNQVAKQVRLAIIQDGQPLPMGVIIDELEAGAEVARNFDVVFPAPGDHQIKVLLPPDSLENDNARYLAVNVAAANPVLIITGNLQDGEALYAQDALAPAAGLTGFAPTIENVEFLRRQSLQKFVSIYLVNVPEIPADALKVLEEYVAQGGGLAWFMGPGVRTAFYNEKLYRAGEGLFPVPLVTFSDLSSDPTNPLPDLKLTDHPLFRAFQGQDNPFVDSVKVSRYFGVPVDWQPPAHIRVIARLRNQAPLFLEHRYGKGAVLTCLTSVGPSWTNWATNPSYVLLQLELEQYLARNPRGEMGRFVGDPLVFNLDSSNYRSQIEIRLPGVTSVTRLNAAPLIAPAANKKDAAKSVPGSPPRLGETFHDTEQPGVYTIIKFRQDDTTEQEQVAYNVSPVESEMALAPTSEIHQRVGSASGIQVHEYGSITGTSQQSAGQEVRDLLLVILLLVVVLEQLLAWKMSYHSQSGGTGR